ncbi:hypothetical protein KJ644_01770 [Candidatus Dependentiae bacterium]|nr:hypothetical protein [Candidatus Dependentiae bacterium]MBU4387180.1 hypothetical protein [Candidatus Dependentiae bacterium]MCG2755995.1 hypothetical protein [Candidatus Dependentiae bacterium]
MKNFFNFFLFIFLFLMPSISFAMIPSPSSLEIYVCAWPDDNDIDGIIYVCDNNLIDRINSIDPVTNLTPLQFLVIKFRQFPDQSLFCIEKLKSLGVNILHKGNQTWSPLERTLEKQNWNLANIFLQDFSMRVEPIILTKFLDIEVAIKDGYEHIVKFLVLNRKYGFDKLLDLYKYAQDTYNKYREKKGSKNFNQNLYISYIGIYSFLYKQLELLSFENVNNKANANNANFDLKPLNFDIKTLK